jgi:hypothetical protein
MYLRGQKGETTAASLADGPKASKVFSGQVDSGARTGIIKTGTFTFLNPREAPTVPF